MKFDREMVENGDKFQFEGESLSSVRLTIIKVPTGWYITTMTVDYLARSRGITSAFIPDPDVMLKPEDLAWPGMTEVKR